MVTGTNRLPLVNVSTIPARINNPSNSLKMRVASEGGGGLGGAVAAARERKSVEKRGKPTWRGDKQMNKGQMSSRGVQLNQETEDQENVKNKKPKTNKKNRDETENKFR